MAVSSCEIESGVRDRFFFIGFAFVYNEERIHSSNNGKHNDTNFEIVQHCIQKLYER